MTATDSPATIRIARRFNGPHDSGNGGYSAGLAAMALGGGERSAIEATLRSAIPLDRALRIERLGDHGLDVLTDDSSIRILVMQLREAALPRPHINSPGLAAAQEAASRYRVDEHPLPNCFVCGPARACGDGLCIFPDPVAGRSNPNDTAIVAAPWTPAADLVSPDGLVAPEFIWAALDCPGAFAIDHEPILLGRMTTRILARPPPGEPTVVVGWSRGSERSKHFASTALFAADGTLLAFAEQVWIAIEAHAPPAAG